jgi:hypothetical protein
MLSRSRVRKNELTKPVESLSSDLANARSVQDIVSTRGFNSKIAAMFQDHPDEEIFARLQRIREGALSDINRSPKVSEFDVFVY